MNLAHVHLILNHMPVLAVPVGLAVLGWAMFRRRPEFVRFALAVFVVAALITIPTYLSGEPAEDAIEGVAGPIEPWVEPHEDAAVISLILVETLGVLALVALWSARRKAFPSHPMLVASLVLGLATAGSLAYTASLGGPIRHTEIRSGAALSGTTGAVPRDRDDDDER
jgi:drug/metabolite transporter (DMT)-like permease